MIVRIHRPAWPVSEVVSHVVYHSGYAPGHLVDRLVPDGTVNLIIDLTADPKHIFDNVTLLPVETFRDSWVSGMRTKPISISAGENSSMVVVSFQPHEAGRVLHEAMHHLSDRVEDAISVVGPGIAALRERLLAHRSPDECFHHVDAWIAGRMRPARTDTGVLAHALQTLSARPESIRVGHVATATGYSMKHLSHLFKEHVGVTPKQVHRVARFQKVLGVLMDTDKPDWARLALEHGYADQAHFIRDFRALAGMTPSAYWSARSTDPNYIAVR